MKAPETSSQPAPVSPEQAQEYESRIWDHASEVNEVRSGLQTRLSEIYSGISGIDEKRASLEQRLLKEEGQKEYWRLSAQLQQIRKHEDELMSILERLEAGEATADEVSAILPEQTTEEKQELSKKKRAILRERERFGIDPRAIAGELLLLDINFVPATDPRRIGSGRNRRRLVVAKGLDRLSAEGSFFDVTADSHGGKSRHNGKKGNFYIGKNGRPIRKK